MRRRVFITLFIATAVAMLGLGVITPILPLYAKGMGATGIELGVIFAAFALSRGVFAPIIGRISDQWGRKNLMVAGLVLLAAVSFGFVYASSALALSLMRFLQGFATVLVTLVAQAYIGDLTPVGQEGKFLNLFFMSFFAGQALGPGFGGYLSDRFAITAPFYAMAALSVVALLLILFLVPEITVVGKNAEQEAPFFRSLLPVFRDRPMAGIMTYMSTRGFYRWGFNTFFPLLAIKAASMSMTGVGVILSVYMLTGAVTQFPFGLVADRYPSRKLALILAGGAVSALAMCAVALGHSMTAYIVLTLVMGIASSVSRASAIAIRTERGRIYGQGAATGAFATSFSLGQVLGPIAFGAIVDVASIPTAFVVGGLIGLIGTVGGVALLKGSASRQEAGS